MDGSLYFKVPRVNASTGDRLKERAMSQASDAWNEPRYAIGLVAEMVSLHPQTLRRYEELGLLIPARKAGRRLYSPRDVELLRDIARLSDELGLNLAGVEVILRLKERIRAQQSELEALYRRCANLEAQITVLQDQLRRAQA